MKSLLLIAFLCVAMPTNADMQSFLDNAKKHNKAIVALTANKSDSNLELTNKSVSDLVKLHDKQTKQLESCKTRDCFQSVIDDNDAVFNALKFKLTLDFLKKTNQLASKNCTDCKTQLAQGEK